MEEELPDGLSERQIPELVDDEEVHAAKVMGEAALPSGARFGLKLVDEVDDLEDAGADDARSIFRQRDRL